MKKYLVNLAYMGYVTYEVYAENEDEAWGKANGLGKNAPPDCGKLERVTEHDCVTPRYEEDDDERR